MKKTLCILIVINILLLSSCSTKEKQVTYKNNYYNTYFFDIPYFDGYLSEVKNVVYKDDQSYLIVMYSNLEVISERYMIMFHLDEFGTLVNQVNIDMSDIAFWGPVNLIDGCLGALTNDGAIKLMSLEDGSEVEKLTFGKNDLVFAFQDLPDGYVILFDGFIKRYFDDGREALSASDSSMLSYWGSNPYFESGGKSYFLGQYENSPCYFEIDYDSGAVTRLNKTRDLVDGYDESYNRFIINYEGIFKADLEEQILTKVASYDYLDIRPEKKTLSYSQDFISDEFIFSKVYTYSDTTQEMLLFKYNSELDFSDRQLLVIGGYNLAWDLALRWGVYEFNTSQDEYRMVFDDYSYKFGYSDGQEMQAMTASIIQYYSEGNAPDIYYGTFFNYDSMARAGELLNLSDYGITYTDEEYFTYPSYTLSGYFGRSDYFESSEVSLSELEAISSEKGILPIYPTESFRILDGMLRFSLKEAIESGYSEHALSIEDLVQMIEFSIDYGVEDFDSSKYASVSDIAEDQVLLYGYECLDLIYFYNEVRYNDFDLRYVGYPTTDGSIHVRFPRCVVGVSAVSEHIDACIDFVNCLFDEDVQKALAVNQSIPVNDEVLEELVEAAVHPENITDEVYRSYMYFYDYSVSEEAAENFMEIVNGAETVSVIDIAVFNILYEEINTYYTQGKTPEEIAETLQARLDLYVAENY